jgi:predicted transcriptional regulator
MARALAVPIRLVIFRRGQRGQTAAEIADALALTPRTVRHLLHEFRDGRTLRFLLLTSAAAGSAPGTIKNSFNML